jgi:hypothetical protein
VIVDVEKVKHEGNILITARRYDAKFSPLMTDETSFGAALPAAASKVRHLFNSLSRQNRLPVNEWKLLSAGKERKIGFDARQIICIQRKRVKDAPKDNHEHRSHLFPTSLEDYAECRLRRLPSDAGGLFCRRAGEAGTPSARFNPEGQH